MIQFLSKRTWMAGCLLLAAACEGPPAPPDLGEPDPQAGKPVTSDTIKTEQFRSWDAAERAAFLKGRVTVAGVLFGAGEAEAALDQLGGLRQRVISVDDGALKALGFDAGQLDALADGIELGREPEVVAEGFARVEESLAEVITTSGAAPQDIVAFLMQLSTEAYKAGVRYNEITDAKAYQSAYGFAVVARDLIAPLDEAVFGDLRLELDILVLMWPAPGPLTGRTPPPEVRMAEQFARVKLALAMLP